MLSLAHCFDSPEHLPKTLGLAFPPRTHCHSLRSQVPLHGNLKPTKTDNGESEDKKDRCFDRPYSVETMGNVADREDDQRRIKQFENRANQPENPCKTQVCRRG